MGLLTLCFCLALAKSDALWPTWSPLPRFHFTIKQRSQLIDSILGQRSLKRSKAGGMASKKGSLVVYGSHWLSGGNLQWWYKLRYILKRDVSILHMFSVLSGWVGLTVNVVYNLSYPYFRLDTVCMLANGSMFWRLKCCALRETGLMFPSLIIQHQSQITVI